MYVLTIRVLTLRRLSPDRTGHGANPGIAPALCCLTSTDGRIVRRTATVCASYSYVCASCSYVLCVVQLRLCSTCVYVLFCIVIGIVYDKYEQRKSVRALACEQSLIEIALIHSQTCAIQCTRC